MHQVDRSHNQFAEDEEDSKYMMKAENLLQENRRKMLRRAANRRSAQLSRARKKANLEELRVENARLQRLVDVLDSQPELVFCMNVDGRISYVSERTETFMKINLSGDGSDACPTHINQILSKESVKSTLTSIRKLYKYSSQGQSCETLFAAKEVYFHDAFGYPLVGSLRCSTVIRRTTMQELQSSDEVPEDSNENGATFAKAIANSSKSIGNKKEDAPGNIDTDNGKYGNPDSGWNQKGLNFANFKLLTDCVCKLTGHEILDNATEVTSERGDFSNVETTVLNLPNLPNLSVNENRDISSNSQSGTDNVSDTTTRNGTSENGSNGSNQSGEEVEFVCIIRTSDNCFVPHNSPSGGIDGKKRSENNGLLLFSSQLSTASMVAHDLGLRSDMSREHGSPVSLVGSHGTTESAAESEENCESNESNSGLQPNYCQGDSSAGDSPSCKKQKIRSSFDCSEETCSEDSSQNKSGSVSDSR
jgi:hypothetical protein